MDNHHLCWPKHDWQKGYAKAIRTHWYFIMKIPRRTLHAKIHHEMMWIPPPKGQQAKAAYEQIIALESYGALRKDDPIEKRLQLLVALFDCAEQPTCDAFKRQLEIVRKFYSGPHNS